tara:strand:+ start:3758 stop:4045 length:288 start_codon:yes stop_codon:yes gene_type:complete
MDSVKKKQTSKTADKTPPKAKIKPVRRPNSLSEGFAQAGLKFKKLGTDWRFSNGATLIQDQEPHYNNISKIVNYMATHPGTNVTVTIASILKGAK